MRRVRLAKTLRRSSSTQVPNQQFSTNLSVSVTRARHLQTQSDASLSSHKNTKNMCRSVRNNFVSAITRH